MHAKYEMNMKVEKQKTATSFMTQVSKHFCFSVVHRLDHFIYVMSRVVVSPQTTKKRQQLTALASKIRTITYMVTVNKMLALCHEVDPHSWCKSYTNQHDEMIVIICI